MATLIMETSAPAPDAPATRTTAVLTAGVDGYPAGTTGRVAGTRQGCIAFAPDHPEHVARWARPRTSLLVPPSFVVEL